MLLKGEAGSCMGRGVTWKTYDFAHSEKPSSWTCTCVPYVTSPTCEFNPIHDHVNREQIADIMHLHRPPDSPRHTRNTNEG